MGDPKGFSFHKYLGLHSHLSVVVPGEPLEAKKGRRLCFDILMGKLKVKRLG